MGYKGAIDYLDLPLGGVEWLPDEILGPWAEGGAETWHTGDSKGLVILTATARGFKLGEDNDKEFGTFYDMAEPVNIDKSMKCVTVGKRKMRSKTPADETTHYVLLIAPKKTDSVKGETIYERVGVGYMAGRFIDLAGSGSGMPVSVQ
jgi:hypothetical protein